ncbi:MAG TPA: amidase family protein, partial [bacterium]|nr:amidase family protein [bacterium]
GSSLNPWNTSKVPGGSSGGSAIAVAADLCVFATGSETAGSIRGPASWCGVTGLKPTYGRVSRYGVIAMASSTDSPGVLTKDVKDAAFLLNVLAGKDPYDATTSPVTPDNYLKSVDTESDVSEDLQGVTIGVPVEYMDAIQDKFYRARIEEALSVFAKLGAKIKEISLLDPKYSIAIYTILQRSEVSSNLGRFSGVRYGEKREEFNFENKKRILLGTYALSSGYYDQYYAKAQKARTLLVEDFKNAFKEVDLIFGPTMPGVALSVGESKNYSMFGELIDLLQEPSSIAGLPAISLPAGMQEGLPVGVQIIANYFEENLMLRVSSAFQKKTEFHKFKPSAQSYEHI